MNQILKVQKYDFKAYTGHLSLQDQQNQLRGMSFKQLSTHAAGKEVQCVTSCPNIDLQICGTLTFRLEH